MDKSNLPALLGEHVSALEFACEFFLLQSAKLPQNGAFSFAKLQLLAIAAELAKPLLICAFLVKEKSGINEFLQINKPYTFGLQAERLLQP